MDNLHSRLARLSPEQRRRLAQKLNKVFAPPEAGPAVTVDKRLVAYVVCEQAEENAVTALRDLVREKLPDYMMPASFVLLDALPRTPNGKVDRQALPEPETGSSNAAFVAPRTETEEILADIWAEVLRVEVIGIHDHFFEMGGHSLLVTQAMGRVRDIFEIDLPLRTLFEAPTIAHFVEILEAALIAELEGLSEAEAELAAGNE